MSSSGADIAEAQQMTANRAALRQTFLLGLFSFSLFLSAAAMFMVQPMLGKMLLPRVGGTPTGWITAVAFFQVMLLLGYLFAHGMARFSSRTHGIGYLALLIAGAAVLPLSLPATIDAAQISAGGVFMLLLTAAGLPFIALSATAATLQRLFLTTSHAQAQDPYFLYAASNLGSFVGLLLYPLLVEPFSTLDTQAQVWFYAYGTLALCAAGCLAAGLKHAQGAKPAALALPLAKDMLRWAFLAFIPSALLLAVTTHIVTDVISAPLVWVLPLALYLLTFVMAFSRRRHISPALMEKIAPAVIAFAFAHTLMMGTSLSASLAIMALHLAGFGVIALMCHQRLAAARPDTAHLTAFYLMIAFGGALGGLLNAFAAPMLLDTLIEYPVLLLAAAFSVPSFRGILSGRKTRLALLAVLAAAVACLMLTQNPQAASTTAALFLAMIAFAATFPRALIVLALVFSVTGTKLYAQDKLLLSERNFFGVLKVSEREVQNADGTAYVIRDFMHGTTLHGYQVVSPDNLRTEPTAYFHKGSPISETLHFFAPQNVAVVGLGAGTLACHSMSARHFTFFEIDPAVIRIAQEHFTFLKDCPGAVPHRLIEGDGRLALAAEQTALYDIIILDAFSSDTIPPHLMTVEAVQMYLSRLNVGGLIAFNISSRYFDMAPVLAAAAENTGLFALYKHNMPDKTQGSIPQASQWIIMGPDRAALSAFADAHKWSSVTSGSASAWHDNYSNILGVLRR
ncbi:MAG: fused MFS/spermidine synthase [Alphaproteobacteria bacterium]|nr:fused MFS/spermidine synthase [Alphaproteobacteria bacterium]